MTVLENSAFVDYQYLCLLNYYCIFDLFTKNFEATIKISICLSIEIKMY